MLRDLRALVATVALSLASHACTEDAPSGARREDKAAPSAGAAAALLGSSSPSPVEDAGPPPSARLPPTGDYRVEVSVVSDDCAVKYTPPKPWEERVFVGAKGKQVRANIRMVAIPPSNATAGPATNRSDVAFEPPKPWKATFMPLRQCPAYTTVVSSEVKSADPTGFSIGMTVEHGESKGCAAQPPSSCTTKIERRYVLVKHLCKPECTFGTKSSPDVDPLDASPTPDVDCRC